MVSAVDIRQSIGSASFIIVTASLLLVLAITSIAIFSGRDASLKKSLFNLCVAVIAVSTTTLVWLNLYLYSKISNPGLASWNAGIEFWVCDVEVEIENPSWFKADRIGSSKIYEADDKKIHVNGLISDSGAEATLGSFMRSIGGSISEKSFTLPIDKKQVEDEVDGDNVDIGGIKNIERFVRIGSDGRYTLTASNGMPCVDGKKTALQVFAYSYDKINGTYSQEKLSDPNSYIISPERDVPPGDCLIIEYGQVKDTTERLCREYAKRDSKRCLAFSGEGDKPKNCTLREVKKEVIK